MDWLFLILLVPAVLIPIVLLFGFCGCGSFDSEEAAPVPKVPVPPTNLHAVLAFARDGIVLSWLNNDGDTVGAQVDRRIQPFPAGGTPDLLDNPTVAGIFVDKPVGGLPEGTTIAYLVRSRLSGDTLTNPSNESKATMPPAPPTDLVAKAVDLDQIDLTWKNGSTHAQRFRIMHRAPGGVFAQIGIANKLTFSHTGLAEDSTHEYQVSAIVDGFNDSMAQEVDSAFTATAVAKTLNWKTTYFQPLNPTISFGYAGNCVVQRIDSAHLMQSGQYVRVTLRGLPNAETRLTAVTISNAVPVSAMEGWDSASPPLNLKFAGSPAVSMTNGQTATSEKVKLKITAGSGQDLAIAMNVESNSQNLRGANVTGVRHYFKPNAAEATVQNRPGGYQTVANRACCIETIEVA